MKYYIPSLFLLMFIGCSTQDKALEAKQNNVTAEKKVQSCIVCHGSDGKSGKAGVPSLGGRPYDELVNAMQSIRDAYSPQPLLGHSLSDNDIKDIATYFSSIE
ncbi:MAG: c-type cytochrome [Methylotenera sp.]|nr:c-type cytochrome [Methylotenera sp.]MDO9388748.1 c-type cytochrome [Methylotenera sp.]